MLLCFRVRGTVEVSAIQNLKGLYKDGNVEDTIYNKAYSLEPGKINRVNRERRKNPGRFRRAADLSR